MGRLKVLVSAYACEPGKGSEPEVGWQWVHQIARFHETWVITRANNRLLIEEGLKKEPNTNLHFVYVDLPAWASFWKKGNRGVHLYYYLWQMLLFFHAARLNRQIKFDLIHHITFINMYMAPWSSLIKQPFIWGPIGANPFIPLKFFPLIKSDGVKDNLLRYLIRLTAKIHDPILLIAQSRAKHIIAINHDVRNRFPEKFQKKITVLPQNAIDGAYVYPYQKKRGQSPLGIIMVGQLVPIKGFSLALKAFSKHLQQYPGSQLTIVGDGKQKNALKQLSKKLNIAHAITFTGQVQRNQVMEIMTKSDVFLFPSFEGAGMVVIEAMAKGLPVVCLDFGGPGEYVTENCGIKVPLTDPEEVIRGLSDALSKLASDKTLYERLSVGAIERVKENYLWDRVGDKLNSIYQEIFKDTKDNAHSK